MKLILKTAHALGLTIPQAVLERADAEVFMSRAGA